MAKVYEDLTNLNTALLADHQTQHLTEATQRVFSDSERLRQLAINKKNICAEKAQGWMFEQLEVLKFNSDALHKGSYLWAATTDSLGKNNHQTTDILISNGKAFQLKSGNKASTSAFMLADQKYKDVNLIAPTEQTNKIQELYKNRIDKGGIKAADYQSASQRLEKGINADNVASGGTRYDEALNCTDPNYANQVANAFELKAAFSDMHQSGIEAGKLSAQMGIIGSGLRELYQYAQGKTNLTDATAQIIVDTSKSFAVSYLTTAGSKGLVHSLAKAGTSQSTIGSLTKSNAHIALSAGIVKAGKSLLRYMQGEIEHDQLMHEVAETAITGVSSFYYGALGQAVIPIPIIGAMVGSTVGYFIGSILHQSGLISLGEATNVKIARERREQIETMCLQSIPLIRQHRLELESLLTQNFTERHKILTQAFDELEKSLVSWDADKFSLHLDAINHAFGKALPFKSFNEFDNFMRDKDTVFVL